MSRLAIREGQTVGPRRRVSNGSAHQVRCSGALLALIVAVQGCATHHPPPECKGPYTPINPSLVAASDGSQR